MSRIEFRCPGCGQLLRAATENAGRKVRCGRCQGVAVVPAAVPPPPPEPPASAPTRRADPARPVARPPAAPRPDPETPDDEPDDQEEARPKKKSKKKRRAEEWKWARTGVLVLLVGAAFSVLGTAWTYLGGLVLPSVAAIATMATVLFVLVGVGVVVELAGLVLCLFAPPSAGTRPVVGAAVGCKVLVAALAVVALVSSLSMVRQMDRSSELTRGGKIDQQRLDEMMAEMKQSTAAVQAHFRLQRVLEIPTTVLVGIAAVVIPLMLRSFCRALGLSDAEPLCERLLQIGIGAFGFQVLIRLLIAVIGYGAFDVLTPLSYLAALLGVIWQVMYTILLVKIWRAMPRTG